VNDVREMTTMPRSRTQSAPFWKTPPREVREIQERLAKMSVKPVDSYAAVLLERHGREFEKEAIRAVIRTR
jgi:hypothetical protein